MILKYTRSALISRFKNRFLPAAALTLVMLSMITSPASITPSFAQTSGNTEQKQQPFDNVTPVITHAALPAALTAAGAAAEEFFNPPTGYDIRLETNFGAIFDLLAQGFGESPAFMYLPTPYCDEAWQFVPTGFSGPLEGTYQIKNRNSGLCLVVRGLGDGSGAVQSTCGKQWKDQLWYVVGRSFPSNIGPVTKYQMVNANSGKCLFGDGGLYSQARQKTCSSPTSYSWYALRWNGRIDGTGRCLPPN